MQPVTGACVRGSFSCTEKVLGDVFEGQHVSTEHFDDEKEVGKMALSKSVTLTTEALQLSLGVGHMNECMVDGQLCAMI